MILYHTVRQQVLTLNGTAAFIWESCDGEHTIQQIAAEVGALFGSATNPGDDVRRLLDRLLREGMITWKSSDSEPAGSSLVSAHA
jgi:hypothetical protein